jgi:copper resistance protein B
MSKLRPSIIFVVVILVLAQSSVAEEDSALPSTTDRPRHGESARQHEGTSPLRVDTPPLPEGMTLDEVFDYAESPPPLNYPVIVPDDRVYVFTLFERLEYLTTDDDAPNPLGWEAQGWMGTDFNKFWWKHEGEAAFEGADEGETETDLLYARLITPFWNIQVGAQYANEWSPDDYGDRWSGVIALQGLAPYKFELDQSLYFSEDGDVTFAFESEYSIRITQRWVLQPRAELGFSAQDIPERRLGAGMTDANLDVRLRYEVRRELAPYVGFRYRFLVGETDHIAEAAGRDSEQVYVLGGLRFAF